MHPSLPFARLEMLLRDEAVRDPDARVRIGIAPVDAHGGRTPDHAPSADLVISLADMLDPQRAVDLQLALLRAFGEVKQCALEPATHDLAVDAGAQVYAAVFFRRSSPSAQLA